MLHCVKLPTLPRRQVGDSRKGSPHSPRIGALHNHRIIPYLPGSPGAPFSASPSLGNQEDYGVDTLKITDDDAAFILGKGGKTKAGIPIGG